MLAGLMLTIGSLLFVILLCIVYFSKRRFLSIRNKIYRYMLIVEITLLVTEIIASFCLYYGNNEIINLLIHRLHWSTGIVWFALLYYYSIVFLNNFEANNLMEVIYSSNQNKVMSVIFIFTSILYFFIPFDRLDPLNISYIPGAASYFVLAFCAFVVILIVIYTLKNGKSAPLRKKVSIWIMMIELIIIFGLQLMFPNIAFSAIGAALQMFFLYFNI